MAVAILTCFLFALVPLFAGPLLRSKLAWITGFFPLGLFIWFLTKVPLISGGQAIMTSLPWAPSLGVDLRFYLDGLSLIFALMITGIGALVFFYAGAYMKGHRYLHRLYGFLSLFMGAMLGVVLSDNIITTFIFWELTSISSFFLIGFNTEDPAARRSALTALGLTGLGGLALLAGGLLLGDITGSYSIQEMVAQSETLTQHGLYGMVIILICLAAFTKSAQFPFHFWLPAAMKAPTPVSTYLHSATMVKAGVFLLMRFSPVLSGTEIWHVTLMTAGGITMVYAAIHTLFRTDLKGILAYSTISALGILVFLVGIGTDTALVAAAVFLLVHALYKAALFLVTGIIDHETGTRDVTRLRGLGRYMPAVAIAALLAALSNAGVPLLYGFIGKDLIYEATLNSGSSYLLLTSLAVITNILLLYAGFQVGIRPFTGKLTQDLPPLHRPALLLWLPPVILATLSLGFGLFPGFVGEWINLPAAKAMGVGETVSHLKIWHGFNTVLWLSLSTLAIGTLMYIFIRPTQSKETWINRLMPVSPETIVLGIGYGIREIGNWWTRTLQNGYLRNYIFTILLFLVGFMAYLLFSGFRLNLLLDHTLDLTVYEVAILGIMFVAILFTIHTRSRLTAIVALGVVGYGISLLFVFYSAPDLAITQFTIDTLTVILFVLVLYRLPRYLRFSKTTFRVRDAVLATFFGLMMILMILEVLEEPGRREIGDYYAANAYVMAKGKNVVNVILVDYRGFDTLVEISVLVIAAIGVFGLLKLRLSKSQNS